MAQKPLVHELTYTEDTIDSVSREIYNIMAKVNILTFQGPLGAGKTTLIQAVLQQAGVYEVTPSPTFSYVNTYTNSRGETFYHFDLYRLNSLDEFLDAGFDEYLHTPRSWVLIEWPEVIMDILKDDVCHFSLSQIWCWQRQH